MKNDKTLSIRVPGDWKPKLKKIAKEDDRDVSYITRKAILAKYPKLLDPKHDHLER